MAARAQCHVAVNEENSRAFSEFGKLATTPRKGIDLAAKAVIRQSNNCATYNQEFDRPILHRGYTMVFLHVRGDDNPANDDIRSFLS